MRRFSSRGAVVVAVAVIYSVVAAVAYGAKPDTSPADPTQSGVVTDICAFPVIISSTTDGVIRIHHDAEGRITRIQLQITETDTFSANGNTIVGLPYQVRGTLFFDAEGNPTSFVGHGVVARMRLPDGQLFVSAGRFLAGPEGFRLVPDVGHSGDVTAFCAALA
jgi:hypothetical protein